MTQPRLFLDDGDVRLYHGDVLDVLADMPAESVDCVVTSPPYWGLRDYGTGTWEGGDEGCEHRVRENPSVDTSTLDGGKKTVSHQAEGFKDECPRCGARRVDQQIGLEPTPDLFVNSLVAVFREVRRVLAPHGTCWINLGDSYVSTAPGTKNAPAMLAGSGAEERARMRPEIPVGLKPKDLVGVPWRVAFALQADGWWLRSDIVWAKPNPMPESVTDRPTKSHEYVFLLTKQPRYFFDQEAVREQFETTHAPGSKVNETQHYGAGNGGNSGLSKQLADVRARLKTAPQEETLDGSDGEAPRGPDGRRVTHVEAGDGSIQHRDGERWPNSGRNVRSVWTIATQPYPEAHFATYPEELVRRCVLAGCPAEVCRSCGTPRERIVEVESSWRSRSEHGAIRGNLAPEGLVGAGTQRAVHGAGVSHDLDSRRREVVGWTDCDCDVVSLQSKYRSGVVLDPFVGSGTTCKVSRDHGRHSIGIDLNADYLELAARRLQQLSLLTSLPAPVPATPLEGAERSATP